VSHIFTPCSVSGKSVSRLKVGGFAGFFLGESLPWYLNGRDCTVQSCWRNDVSLVWARHSTALIRWSEIMDYNVLEARYVSGFTLWVRFRDGRSGEIDLTHALNGPVFEPLHDVEYFKRFRVHPEWKTLYWPNGADIAPEFLYEHVRVAA